MSAAVHSQLHGHQHTGKPPTATTPPTATGKYVSSPGTTLSGSAGDPDSNSLYGLTTTATGTSGRSASVGSTHSSTPNTASLSGPNDTTPGGGGGAYGRRGSAGGARGNSPPPRRTDSRRRSNSRSPPSAFSYHPRSSLNVSTGGYAVNSLRQLEPHQLQEMLSNTSSKVHGCLVALHDALEELHAISRFTCNHGYEELETVVRRPCVVATSFTAAAQRNLRLVDDTIAHQFQETQEHIRRQREAPLADIAAVHEADSADLTGQLLMQATGQYYRTMSLMLADVAAVLVGDPNPARAKSNQPAIPLEPGFLSGGSHIHTGAVVPRPGTTTAPASEAGTAAHSMPRTQLQQQQGRGNTATAATPPADQSLPPPVQPPPSSSPHRQSHSHSQSGAVSGRLARKSGGPTQQAAMSNSNTTENTLLG